MKTMRYLHKVKTVLLHPVASLRVLGYHYAQWRGRKKLVAAGLRPQLERVEEKCRLTGAFPPNYMELWHLYEDVRRLRPRVIFEFGSGLSTNIMAAALAANSKDGAPGKLYSFESERKWWEASDQWLESQTRAFVDLVHAPVRTEEVAETTVFKHSGIPDLVPDMMYLDGPALTPEIRSAADMLDFEPRLRPGFWLVIDGRRDNAEFLTQHLRRSYRISTRTGFLGGAYFQRCFELLDGDRDSH